MRLLELRLSGVSAVTDDIHHIRVAVMMVAMPTKAATAVHYCEPRNGAPMISGVSAVDDVQ